ncbi:UBA/TS-N domain family protein [Saccharomyces cerevisiae]|nr:UBA/TS-N domain family protein [Saccharomyces cerevisiae]
MQFTVLDTDIDILIGLDMLKRHLACVDLKENVLRIAEFKSTTTTGGCSCACSKDWYGPTPTGRSTAGATTATGRTFPEQTIKQLMDLGFPRDAVVKALKQTNGNAEFAASLLFQ